MSRRSPALCAAGRQAKRTTFASPSRAPWAVRSATNTRSPSAASITGISTAMGRGLMVGGGQHRPSAYRTRAVAAIALDQVTCNGIGTSSAHTLAGRDFLIADARAECSSA